MTIPTNLTPWYNQSGQSTIDSYQAKQRQDKITQSPTAPVNFGYNTEFKPSTDARPPADYGYKPAEFQGNTYQPWEYAKYMKDYLSANGNVDVPNPWFGSHGTSTGSKYDNPGVNPEYHGAIGAGFMPRQTTAADYAASMKPGQIYTNNGNVNGLTPMSGISRPTTLSNTELLSGRDKGVGEFLSNAMQQPAVGMLLGAATGGLGMGLGGVPGGIAQGAVTGALSGGSGNGKYLADALRKP